MSFALILDHTITVYLVAIIRRFGANLQNTQAAAQVQPPAEDVNSAEDVTTWGATKRRTTQPKARETNSGSSDSQACASSNSSVASNQIGNPARLRAYTRTKVVKKEKEQTLTASLTERSEVTS